MGSPGPPKIRWAALPSMIFCACAGSPATLWEPLDPPVWHVFSMFGDVWDAFYQKSVPNTIFHRKNVVFIRWSMPQTAKIMSRGFLPIIIMSLLDHHLIAIITLLVDHHWIIIISFIIKSFSNHYSIIIRTPLDHNHIIIRSSSHHYHIVVTSSSDPYQINIKLPFINQPSAVPQLAETCL